MSKWVEVRGVRRPAAEVAAEILELRMQAVQQMLPLAAFEHQADIEHVHQLRVSCRRAGAALRAFRPLVSGKSKRLRKWLQRIRRAAGPARDADVLLKRLGAEPTEQTIHTYIVARLERQRLNVQQALIDVASKAQSGKLNESVARCLKALRKQRVESTATSFKVFAHESLKSASQAMFALAEMEQPTVAQLHQLRIASKRLRYSIELFHSAFPFALRQDVYPLVEKIQGQLGKLNDHATAQVLFQRWMADLPPNERAAQLAYRIAEEYQATDRVRAKFLDWWTSQRVAALESHLCELIHPDS